ncbi:uncharacterized protein LOC126787549 [Argentina anserina]|uniref:uncharacterized protein LOC126787549 n=1 Tax=Argentina anserina TaxID=57926 RepID=UPI0021766830|nr:uncharacterized protein LOC126787549 [Potentilla anserina]
MSRSTIENVLSSLRIPSRCRCSIVEKLLRDAKASVSARVLNFWVKVYVDINDLAHSDTNEGMNSNTEEEDIDSDTEEEIADIDSDMEEEISVCSMCNEEIVVGSEEIRISCTRMYHRDCIVK